MARTFSNVLADSIYIGDIDEMRDLARVVDTLPEFEYVRIFRSDGQLLVDSEEGKYPLGTVISDVSSSAVAERVTQMREHEHMVIVASPILAGPEVLGVVEFGLTTEGANAEIQSIIKEHVWQGLALIGLGLILAYILARQTTKPLRAVAVAAESMGGGQLDTPILVGGTKETVQLGLALERMRVQLRSLYQGLEQQVAHRTQELQHAEEQLRITNEFLETRVEERTQELTQVNASLRQEIQDRKSIENQLRDSQTQLRALSSRLQSTREEERTTLAREIHDDLGQTLTAMKLDLSWIYRGLDARSGNSPGLDLKERIQSFMELIDTNIQSVREISIRLRPSILDLLGLAAAMEWQLMEFQQRTGIETTMVGQTEESNLDQDQSTSLFRILQEALTNVTRHAEATRVDVRLKNHADEITLEVIDNGRGITKSEGSALSSLGLLGMRERAAALGGDASISGNWNSGTTVRVRIPVTQVDSEAGN